MAGAMDESKQKFFESLAKLSKGSSSPLSRSDLFKITDEFLFDFCRFGGPLNLNETEKQLIGSQLSDALSIMESGLRAAFWPLDADRRQTAKLYRSAVQFLVDDFRNLNVANDATAATSAAQGNPLSERLAELLKCGPVESLDDDLVGYQDDAAIGEFPMMEPPVDVTEVPSNHTWWTEDDRNPEIYALAKRIFINQHYK